MNRELLTILESASHASMTVTHSRVAEKLDQATRKLPPQLTAQFLALFRDPNNWFRGRKRCVPQACVLITFHNPAQAVHIALAHNCQRWNVAAPYHIAGFYDPVAAEIATIIKRTFPEQVSQTQHAIWKAEALRQKMT